MLLTLTDLVIMTQISKSSSHVYYNVGGGACLVRGEINDGGLMGDERIQEILKGDQ